MSSSPLTNSEVVALFDARPEGFLVRQTGPNDRGILISDELGTLVRGARHPLPTWTELDAQGRNEVEKVAASTVLSHLKSEGTPLSLLFGRNGAGKSLLIQSLLNLQSNRRTLLSSSALFRFPTSEDSKSWRESVFAAKDSVWLKDIIVSMHGQHEYETNADFLEEDALSRIFCLPFVDVIRRSLLRDPVMSGPDFFGLDKKSHLELLGFDALTIEGWEQREEMRWGPNRLTDESYEIRPFAFAQWPEVRSLVAEFYFHYASRMTVVRESGLQSSYGEHWASTVDWIASPEHAMTVGPAVEEFMTQFTHVELLGPGHCRFLAPADCVPKVMKYIQSCRDFLLAQKGDYSHDPQYSLPLDIFRMQDGGELVESFILRIKEVNQQPGLIEVVDLTFPDSSSSAMSDLLSELVSRHLDLSVVLPKEGTNALGLWLEGYDSLRAIGESVSELVKRCEAGVEGVRIRGFEQDPLTWAKIDGAHESLRRFRNFRGNPFEAIPRPFVEWKDSNSGGWFDFDQASLGQRQLMLIFFAVELLVGRDRRPPLTIVVGDEVDRNLHWRASSRMLEELNERLGGVMGLSVMFSTHSVPALGSPKLAGINRLFAVREGRGFSFVQSRDADEVVLAEVLGVSPSDALRFADLLLVVEGDHEELIISEKLLDGHPLRDRIHLINSGGIYAWNGILGNTLQHLDAPILFVYDKRNESLENEWERILSRDMQNGILPRWSSTEFAQLKSQIKDRKINRCWKSGDDEAEKILFLLENYVFEPRSVGLSRLQPNATLAKRIVFHGVELDDIVDVLPIKYFPEALKKFKSWERAHEEIKSGVALKNSVGIHHGSIRRALHSDKGARLHPELQKLLEKINAILSRSQPGSSCPAT